MEQMRTAPLLKVYNENLKDMTPTHKEGQRRLSAKIRHFWIKTKHFIKKRKTISFCIRLLCKLLPPIIGWIFDNT